MVPSQQIQYHGNKRDDTMRLHNTWEPTVPWTINSQISRIRDTTTGDTSNLSEAKADVIPLAQCIPPTYIYS